MATRMNGSPDELYDMDVALPILKMLSGRTRLEILAALVHEEIDVHTLAERLGLDEKVISHQLQALKQWHTVEAVRDRTRHVYRLNGVVVVEPAPNALQLTIRQEGCEVMIRIPSRQKT